MAHPGLLGGMTRPCAARSAAPAGWGLRVAPASPLQPVVNMTVLSSFQPNGHHNKGGCQSNTGTSQSTAGGGGAAGCGAVVAVVCSVLGYAPGLGLCVALPSARGGGLMWVPAEAAWEWHRL